MSRTARALRSSFRNETPVPYTRAGGGGILGGMFGSRSGRNMVGSMEAYSAVSTLFAVVSKLANASSQVHWDLWRKDPSGDPELRTRIMGHPAQVLWEKPNKFFTRQEWFESGQQHIDLTGEGWTVIEYFGNSKLPVGLWGVRPDRMEPVPSATEYLAGYIYHGPGGQDIPLRLDEVLFIRMPNPLDPFRGSGPVQSLLMTLDSTKFSQEWNRNFFLNSAEPGGIIEVPKTLTDPEFDSMQKRWNESHRGVSRAHRVGILENATYNALGYSQRDMQFAELQQVSRDTILEAFTMQRSIMGITENVNLANALAGKTDFADLNIRPRLERWKQMANNDYLPLFGPLAKDLEFDYTDPIPQDSDSERADLTARTAAAKVLVSAGFDRVPSLIACGLPEIEWVGIPANIRETVDATTLPKEAI